MRSMVLSMIGAATATLLAAGCASPPAGDRLANIGSDPDLWLKVSSFYDGRGQEGGFNCPGVRMDGVTRSEVLSRAAGRAEVKVTYYHKVDDAPPFELGGARCNGFDTRTFTFAEAPGGRYDVISMTGEQVN